MKTQLCLGIAALASSALSGYAYDCQTPREMRAAVENLNFVQGAPGASPPGWYLGPDWYLPPHEAIYEAQIAPAASCNGSQQCGTVRSIRSDPSFHGSFLYQVVDASKYRGKRLTFRASVRVQGEARLLVRVHLTNCGTSFRDDMGNHPIVSDTWAVYEIQAPIAMGARDIEFGMQLIGQGTAWIDNLSMVFADTVPRDR